MKNSRYQLNVIFIFILLLGCTNRYFNTTYQNYSYGDKKLVVLPPRIDDLIISDSTVLDFISEDFSVNKDSAFMVLDSIIHRNIERSFISNADNILVVKCPFPNGNDVQRKDQKKQPDITGASSYRILKRLGIAIPPRQSLIESGITSHMALVLGKMDLDISFEVETFFGIPKGSPRYELDVEDLAYAIWDYTENRLVSCGELDINSDYPRCDQMPPGSTRECDNKEFWNVLLQSLGASIVAETPFDKQKVDSVMNDSAWHEMKASQFREPLRDSAIIAGTLSKFSYPIGVFLAGNDSLFRKRDTIRFNCTISPNGHISSINPIDSVKIDSVSFSGLKEQLDKQLFDPIDNQRHCTFVTIGMTKSSPEKCVLQKVRHGEGRSKASIMRVVMQELAELRYAYNRRLADGLNKNGKITARFKIDESGKVAYTSIIETTIADTELENNVAEIIRSWRFGRIYNKGDICEVVYPFIFSR